MVTGMPEFQVEKEGVCPGCAEGKLKRGPFPQAKARPLIYYSWFTQAYLRLALRGRLLHHILLIRMVWRKGRTA